MVRVKDKFQVTIPKDARQKVGLQVGDTLEIKVRSSELVMSVVPDPSKKLGELLGNFKFTRRDREKASKVFTKLR